LTNDVKTEMSNPGSENKYSLPAAKRAAGSLHDYKPEFDKKMWKTVRGEAARVQNLPIS
jgi:hypothetical protein